MTHTTGGSARGRTRQFKTIVGWLAGAAVVTIAVVLALTPSTQSTNPRQTLRIGVGPWVGFGPIYLAAEKGLFERRGLRAEIIELTGLAERNAALSAGKIDALAAPVDYFVLAGGNGLQTRIVMAIDESFGGDGIVGKPPIQSLRDLKGKRIAVQQGLPGDFFLRTLLQREGIQQSDLSLVDMETAQAGSAFIAGKVDAAVLWEPWLSRAKEQGQGQIIASTKTERDLIVDVLAFNDTFVTKQPDVVKKAVAAIDEAINSVHADLQATSEIMARHFQLDANKYRAIVEGVRFCDATRNREYFGVGASTVPIKNVANFAYKIWSESGRLSKTYDPTTLVSADFVGF